MSPETRILLAQLAESLLALVAFVLLVLASAALYMTWRGLRSARLMAPAAIARARELAARAEAGTLDTATAIVAPQIRLASAWVGLKAGARTLVAGRPDGAGPPPDAVRGAPRRVDHGAPPDDAGSTRV